MTEIHQPPFTMTEEITNLIIEIGDYVGTNTTYDATRPNAIFCRKNPINTIRNALKEISKTKIETNVVTNVVINVAINEEKNIIALKRMAIYHLICCLPL